MAEPNKYICNAEANRIMAHFIKQDYDFAACVSILGNALAKLGIAAADNEQQSMKAYDIILDTLIDARAKVKKAYAEQWGSDGK